MLTDIILFIVGVITGAMNAIAGGGMLLGFPVLVGVGGLSALAANASTFVIVLPGQIASALGYRNYLRKMPRQYLLLAIPCAIGAGFGSYILRHTSASSFQELIPGLILFAVVLFSFQPLLHFHLHQHMTSRKKNNIVLWMIALALLPLGVYGGYFGAGFGFVMLAFLGFTSLHDVHKMNALKNVAAACMAVISISMLSGANLINWHAALFMGVGGVIGGYGGSQLAQKIPSHAVRIFVIAAGISAAIYLGLHTY